MKLLAGVGRKPPGDWTLHLWRWNGVEWIVVA